MTEVIRLCQPPPRGRASRQRVFEQAIASLGKELASPEEMGQWFFKVAEECDHHCAQGVEIVVDVRRQYAIPLEMVWFRNGMRCVVAKPS